MFALDMMPYSMRRKLFSRRSALEQKSAFYFVTTLYPQNEIG